MSYAEYNEDDEPIESVLAHPISDEIEESDDPIETEFVDDEDIYPEVLIKRNRDRRELRSYNSIRLIADRIQPLSPEEEQKITDELFESRNDLWVEKMLMHNLRFAMQMAYKYQIKGESREDAVQRALLGMIKAAHNYKPSSGVRFLTYAGPVMMSEFREGINYSSPKAIMLKSTQTVLDAPLTADSDCDVTKCDVVVRNDSDPTHNCSSLSTVDQQVREVNDGNSLTRFLRSRLEWFIADREKKTQEKNGKKLPEKTVLNSFDRTRGVFELCIVGGLSTHDAGYAMGVSHQSLDVYRNRLIEFFKEDRELNYRLWADWEWFFTEAPASVFALDETLKQFDTSEEFEGLRSLRKDVNHQDLPDLKDPPKKPIVKSSREAQESDSKISVEMHSWVGISKSARDKYDKNSSQVQHEHKYDQTPHEHDHVAQCKTTNWSAISISVRARVKQCKNLTVRCRPWYGGFYSEYNRKKLQLGAPPPPYLEGEELEAHVRNGNIDINECRRLSNGELFWSAKESRVA